MKMSYRQMLVDELYYYTSRGYIPRLKTHLMNPRELEKIVDYCFCIEYHKNYDEFIETTNTGYKPTTIKEIEKIIDKYKESETK